MNDCRASFKVAANSCGAAAAAVTLFKFASVHDIGAPPRAAFAFWLRNNLRTFCPEFSSHFLSILLRYKH